MALFLLPHRSVDGRLAVVVPPDLPAFATAGPLHPRGRSMKRSLALLAVTGLAATAFVLAVPEKKSRPLNVAPPHISTDRAVRYDYDIVYVRAPRKGDDKQIAWSEVFSPLRAEPGSDLMLLHPDGKEEVLIAAGDDAITDPFVSFDGELVYFARFHNVKKPGTA